MISGPEVLPRSGKVKNLVILLHGVGADGANLIDIAHFLRKHLPDTIFVSPNGPEHYDMAMSGYQWFSLQDRSEDKMLEGLNRAMKSVNEFVDYQMQKFNIAEENIAIIGFSQGTMVALHTFVRRARDVALVAGFSGTLIAPHLLDTELKSRPCVLLLHGEEDSVVPIKFMKLSHRELKKRDVPIESYSYRNLGHSINEEGLTQVMTSLKSRFKIDKPA